MCSITIYDTPYVSTDTEILWTIFLLLGVYKPNGRETYLVNRQI